MPAEKDNPQESPQILLPKAGPAPHSQNERPGHSIEVVNETISLVRAIIAPLPFQCVIRFCRCLHRLDESEHAHPGSGGACAIC